MPLKPCADCGREISELASACPQCGRPNETAPAARGSWSSAWQALEKIRAPLNMFGFAMMMCAAIFGYSSTQIGTDALTAFTYAIHIFLAVAGMFFVCLLFCRKSIYHPDDLIKAKQEGVDLGPGRPVLAAVLIGIMMLGYAAYQAFYAS